MSSVIAQKKVPFNTSTVVPSAEGNVKAKKDKNGNYELEVYVENLAEPKKLTPAKSVYVVWIETKESGTKKIGLIHTGSSMFSKTKKASISTSTPNKPVRVFISAEDDPNVETPGTTIVLTTNSFE